MNKTSQSKPASPAIIDVELPWFPKEITAHNTGHWRGKAESVAQCRALASGLAKMAIRAAGKIDGPAWVEYRFYVSKMSRDEANLIQCCKPYVDGCVDAGLIQGDTPAKLRIWGSVFEKAKNQFGQKIVLRFSPIELATRLELADKITLEQTIYAVDS